MRICHGCSLVLLTAHGLKWTNVYNYIEIGYITVVRLYIVNLQLRRSWLETVLTSLCDCCTSHFEMVREAEIPVLRGFLKPSEATEWKQNVFSSAGEITNEVCENQCCYHTLHVFRCRFRLCFVRNVATIKRWLAWWWLMWRSANVR